MRTPLLSTAAIALVLGASGTAFADVEVLAEIDKTKDIRVVETIRVTKDATITVTIDDDVTKAAESDSIINQSNDNNDACGNCAEKADRISGSVSDNNGAITVNQAAGNNNNQASALTAAVDVGDGDTGNGDTGGNGTTNGDGNTGFAQAQAAVDQRNGVVKTVTIDDNGDVAVDRNPAGNVVESVQILFRDAALISSINRNTGFVAVNQATGQMNNQANNGSIAVALDEDGGVALSEAELGQENANNRSSESEVVKSALAASSVNGNQGIVLVNQASGNMANQSNVLSLGAAVSDVRL